MDCNRYGCNGILRSKDYRNAALIRERYTAKRTLQNGVNVVFKPIECADKEPFKEFFKSLSPASVHFRFFGIIKELPNEAVERFCDLDYSQEMAIVAMPKDGRIVAVARLEVAKKAGEFALVIADAWQGLGLGLELLRYLVGIARDYGLVELHCFVSSDNLRMIALAEKVGLKLKSSEGDVLEMSMRLNGLDDVPIDGDLA